MYKLDKKLAIIGAGNLATRVSIELYNQGINIIQVYSRTIASALTLAKLIGCPYVTQTKQITDEADIYLVAVNDMAICSLLDSINLNNKLVVHTAGSVPMSVLDKYSSNYGVFYPLQTFSKYREVDFSKIYFCIEANSAENEQLLIELASVISDNVRIINSEQRKQIHLAAIFANNFTNHMYAIAEQILYQKDLPFDMVKPLISETASKINDIMPREAQTGPAIRNDRVILNDHLKMLNENPQLSKIYSLLSENIYEYHKTSK